jgi:RNA polymerase sigma-70 factor, ECF subfamily
MQLAYPTPLPMKLDGECEPVRASQTPHSGVFEEIYRRWFGAVCTWIRGMGGPDADREDIAQDVFLVVRRRLDDFDGANLPGWLYRITQRQVRDFRRRAWFRHLFSRRNPGEMGNLAHGGASPATALEQKEDERMLYGMLSKIGESRRLTFILYEIEGLCGEEIAQIQGIPLGTVWTRLHHARRDFFALAAKLHRSAARGSVEPEPEHENANEGRDGR